MERNLGMNRLFGLIVLGVLIGFSSCRTTRVAPTTKAVARPMSTVKLIRNMENNAFDYKYLSIKKINCQFDNGRMSTSFKASIQAEKDEQITLMISKLNIPMARLWLTPDSVKFINYLENTYFLDDYSYLSSTMGMNLSFDIVNAIISNNVFLLKDEKREAENDYQTSIDQGMYVLQSVKNQQIPEQRAARKIRKAERATAVHQKMVVDPATFKLHQLTLEDAQNTRKVNVEFSEFLEVGKQLYPGQIFLSLLSPENRMQMKIKLDNFSLEKERSVRFKVPEKFTRTGHE